MQKLTVFIAFIALAASNTTATDRSSFEKALNDEWHGKIKVLRQPCAGDRVAFDLSSGAIGACKEYSWATDTIVEIEDVRVTDEGFRVDARRIGIGFDTKKGEFGTYRTGERVRVETRMGYQPTELADAEKFFTAFSQASIRALADLAPPHWQTCLRGESTRDAKRKRWFCSYPRKENSAGIPEWTSRSNPELVPVFQLTIAADGTRSYSVKNVEVYHWDKTRNITPPRPIFTPDPSYPPGTREAGVQGRTVLRVLLDATGRAQDIQVVGPVGAGLDDQAAHAIQGWQFAPATLDGKPVPVLTTVEMNFRLQ